MYVSLIRARDVVDARETRLANLPERCVTRGALKLAQTFAPFMRYPRTSSVQICKLALSCVYLAATYFFRHTKLSPPFYSQAEFSVYNYYFRSRGERRVSFLLFLIFARVIIQNYAASVEERNYFVAFYAPSYTAGSHRGGLSLTYI